MLSSSEIRQAFLDFFKSKQHTIVPSAPIVIKNDPTLLFTNAGMNQFKDYFLGNKTPEHKRVADTQKCLRVSGKHNDLEEVGVDTYHHTMFEMLGNWSFGDYFKKEAIAWSWELLTEVLKIDKSRLYVTVFEGDEKENLPFDDEAYNEWKKWIDESHILKGNKKDNFWEMGDTGPCGPCSEIHYDNRSDEERKQTEGATLVNADNPQVIEIWNNVFMQFNRVWDNKQVFDEWDKENKNIENYKIERALKIIEFTKLVDLPAKHVDTGMGFERLVRVIQTKQSNYDTDVFTGTIAAIENITHKKYDFSDSKEAIAFRVLADHIRAISFTIADGQLPSNTGAGYVIRRILRRAVRYYYSYLDYKQPLLFQLVPVLAAQFEHVFPELYAQKDFVTRVVKEEEDAFLRTLGSGLQRFKIIKGIAYENFIRKILERNNISFHETHRSKKAEPDFVCTEQKVGIEVSFISVNSDKQNWVKKMKEDNPQFKIIFWDLADVKSFNIQYVKQKLEETFDRKLDIPSSIEISGIPIFELYDTYGFPFDLTKLIASENNFTLDEAGFEAEMQQQKNRSRAATTIDTEDWILVNEVSKTSFVGYDSLEATTKVVKYRKVKAKGKEQYQIVLATTPFYAESGGQVGDTGKLIMDNEELTITDTKKENGEIIHFTENILEDMVAPVQAIVDKNRRTDITYNHTATHLMHAALRQVLGTHVAQKGSLVSPDILRFDFSHFAKMTDEEISHVEAIVNEKIRENIPVVIKEMLKEEALKLGAMALFGEKYGDTVRVVIADPNYSVELCGGTHVGHTGEIGVFSILAESAVAAGVRRVEALTGAKALNYFNEKLKEQKAIAELLKSKDTFKAVEKLLEEKSALEKRIEGLEARQLVGIRNELLQKDELLNIKTLNGQEFAITFIGEVIEISNADALKKLSFDFKNNLRDFVVVLCANIGGKPSVAVSISDTVVTALGLDAGKIIKEIVAPLIKGGGGGQKTLATAGGQDASNLKEVVEKVKEVITIKN